MTTLATMRKSLKGSQPTTPCIRLKTEIYSARGHKLRGTTVVKATGSRKMSHSTLFHYFFASLQRECLIQQETNYLTFQSGQATVRSFLTVFAGNT